MNRRRAAFLSFALFTGVFLGVSGFTFYYAKGFSYLSTDPKACANCHVMQPQYDGWQKSSHHAAAVCADCHMPQGFIAKYYTKAENGYLHSKAFTLQNYPDPIQIRDSSLRVLNSACLKCHADLTYHIEQRATTKQDEIRNCTRCHSGVGH